MNLAVVGTGYVGLVAGTCFAETGNDVICVDIDERKIAMLKEGKVPIYEPGLEEMVQRNAEEQRLFFTTELNSAVKRSTIVFIAVGRRKEPTEKRTSSTCGRRRRKSPASWIPVKSS